MLSPYKVSKLQVVSVTSLPGCVVAHQSVSAQTSNVLVDFSWIRLRAVIGICTCDVSIQAQSANVAVRYKLPGPSTNTCRWDRDWVTQAKLQVYLKSLPSVT